MTETSHGLRLQASAAIAANADMIRVLSVLMNKADDTDHTAVPIETLISLRDRLENDGSILQKYDKKIEKLEQELFNA